MFKFSTSDIQISGKTASIYLNISLSSNNGLSSLSETGKNDLKENIIEIITILNKHYVSTLTVTENGLNDKISGPYIAVRNAINIGFIFKAIFLNVIVR